MSKLSLSATLLTLFTSPEHAQSIEGDLMEEARPRGRIWFRSKVVRTTLALWWKGFSESPLVLLGLMVACGAAWLLILVFTFMARASVEFAFRSLGDPIMIRALVPGILGSLLAGFVFVRAVPVRGIYASVAVACVVGPVSTVLFIAGRPVEGITDLVIQFAAGATTVGPLLLGSAVSRLQGAGKASRTH